MTEEYTPPKEILQKYAQVLVKYALNSGKGVKAGDVVECAVPDVAKPLALELQNVLLNEGAQPIMRLLPTGFDRDFFKHASESQLTFFPDKYLKSKVKLLDHMISIIAQVDPFELSETDPKKIMLSRDSKTKYREWLFDKEYSGKFTWTAAMWGEPAKAKLVNLSLEDYWDQIIKACFLDKADPVSEWRSVAALQSEIQAKLNDLKIHSIHVEGEDIDLKLELGEDRKWLGGSGRNIPSFELFTSPNWRGSNGWVRFNEPLYRYGQVIRDVYLQFKKGLVVEATASQGNELLQQMLKTKNANKIGEFSLTDTRMSRITHPMAETLFDENIGGPYGNTHLAIGMAYKDAYRGDPAQISKKEWSTMGFNDSPEHTDIVSTTNRTVTATHTGGTSVIYTDGKFVL